MKKLLLAAVVLMILGGSGVGAILYLKPQLRAKILEKVTEKAKPAPSGCKSPAPAEPLEGLPAPGPLGPSSPSPVQVPQKHDACPAHARTLTVPVLVNRHRATRRSPNITSFMVPFAKDALLYSVNGLIVRDEKGKTLPSQFEVLSRWGAGPHDCGAPIRHAFVHVHGMAEPGTTVVWQVEFAPEAPPAPKTGMTVETHDDRWVISTGEARFTVRRDRFEGLSKVELIDGKTPFLVSELLGDPGEAGFLLTHSSKLNTAQTAPWRYEIERTGPVTTTVVARGHYGAADVPKDLAYTVRMHFYAGSGSVRIEHTYYNGDVEGYAATEAANATEVAGAWLELPLALRPERIMSRATKKIYRRNQDESVAVVQKKRTGEAPDPRYSIEAAGEILEEGNRARRPFLAANGIGYSVMATVAHMHARDPQGVRWDPQAKSIQVDFTSEPMRVGGARGIWSVVALDFAKSGGDISDRAESLQMLAERPFIATTRPRYLNRTDTIGPYAEHQQGRFAAYFPMLTKAHKNTLEFMDEVAIGGVQSWPDLPGNACVIEGTCQEGEFIDGGENNYWNWSKPSFDEFFRTGLNERVYDFALPEAITFAETLAFRPDHDKLESNGMTGLAACYGSSRGFGETYREGLNNRVDNCPGDYSYNKHLRYAYLATGDRRFVDFFEEAGLAAVDQLGFPAEVETVEYGELTVGRLAEQRIENLMNGAEFSRHPETSKKLVDALKRYVDFMLAESLLDGHMCDTSGSGLNSACAAGFCESPQAWMVPTPLDFFIRAQRFLGHAGLRKWLAAYTKQAMKHHTVLDASGHPDMSKRDADDADDAKNGWRTTYRCDVTGAGITAGSCKKVTDIESEGRFYDNGLVAFLNVFGMLLAADPTDPHEMCLWLPELYRSTLAAVHPDDLNGLIWGKASGQALAFSAEAVGALSRCK